ncbi:DUF6493 family protein [Bacteroides thetaiotaomicron]|nr:DUF6493 family protein [Bacteroides thetaiotaomicron]
MVNWFAGLFEELQPRAEELISLQEEIMQVFTSPYTKPVNVMLQQLKKDCLRRRVPLSGVYRACDYSFLFQSQKLIAHYLFHF